MAPLKKRKDILSKTQINSKKIDNQNLTQNNSNNKNSLITKKLPEIFKEPDINEKDSQIKLQENEKKIEKKSHKKTKAIDYKITKHILEKKNEEDPKSSNRSLNHTIQENIKRRESFLISKLGSTINEENKPEKREKEKGIYELEEKNTKEKYNWNNLV